MKIKLLSSIKTMDRKKKIRLLVSVLAIILLAGLGMTMARKSQTIQISGQVQGQQPASSSDDAPAPATTPAPAGDRSPLSGLACANAKARPLAVTMAGDREARPLSGIGQADLVIEMPVITDSITRYLAFFVCNQPAEIGSVRSTRHDFIPLAMGYDAIMAHWGGSHFALDKLKTGIMDHINAIALEGSVFYRKLGIAAPHNGFTSYDRLQKYSQQQGFSQSDSFAGNLFWDAENPTPGKGRLTIGYPGSFKVEYEYDSGTNSYLRFKGGTREMDKNTNTQVETKNVVIMYAASRQIEGQYNDLDIEGTGKAVIYQNGKEIRGKWSKDQSQPSSKLFFYTEDDQEIKFVPGSIWIQVVQPNQNVDWTFGL